MTQDEQPKLTLGEPPKGLARKTNGRPGFLWTLIILLQAATLVILLFFAPQQNSANGSSPAAEQPAADLKTAALALEEKSLGNAAAEAWGLYLEAAPQVEERAQILYRMGKLHFDEGAYEEAAGAFVRAEIASAKDPALMAKIGPKMVACLRNLGRYGEVSRELSRRVEKDNAEPGRGKVLATFAGEALTEADLDRMIEARVDQMLALNNSAGDEAARAALLKQFNTPERRQPLFQEILQSELFSRRALELKLDQEESFQASKAFLETNLLASAFLQKEMGAITPTDVDLEAFYKAHGERYEEPESLEIRVIEAKDPAEAEQLLDPIQSAEDFLEQAEDTPWVVRSGQEHPRLGQHTEALFNLEEGAWTTAPLEHQDRTFLALVTAKIPSRRPTLAEARDRVLQDYTQKKQQEVGEKILNDLMIRYEVKIQAAPAEQEAD